MTIFTKTANDVFAGYDSAGNARSINPHDGQVWGTEVERTLQGVAAGATIYDSKADMEADTSQSANAMAWVLGDPVTANNGIYQFDGTSTWTRRGDLPYSYIKATNAGAGTANAIQATTSVPVPAADGGALIALPIIAENTASPVTVSFNGGAALTVKNVDGSDPQSGDLTAGMIVAGYVSGSTFRLISDPSSVHNKDAAEAAQAASEAARDIAAGYASDAVSQGNVPIYATKAGMSDITLPPGLLQFQLRGRGAVGDSPLTTWDVIGAVEPDVAPALKGQDQAGTWFVLNENRPTIDMFTAFTAQAKVDLLQARMAAGEAVKIACYGDSTTDGNYTDGWTANPVDANNEPVGQIDHEATAPNAWPAKLKALLHAMHGNESIEVWNAGYSGKQIQDGWAYRNYERAVIDNPAYGRPDACIVAFGLNDVAVAGSQLAAHLSETRKLCLKVMAYAGIPILLSCDAVGWSALRDNKEVRREIDAAKRALAAELSIPFLDVSAAQKLWLGRNKDGYAWLTEQSDLLHFENNGHAFKAGFVAKALFADCVVAREGQSLRVPSFDSGAAAGYGGLFRTSNTLQGGTPTWGTSDKPLDSPLIDMWVWNENPDALLIYRGIDHENYVDAGTENAPKVSLYDPITGADVVKVPAGVGFNRGTSPFYRSDLPYRFGRLPFGLSRVRYISGPTVTGQFLGNFEIWDAPPARVTNALRETGYFQKEFSLSPPAQVEFLPEMEDGSNSYGLFAGDVVDIYADLLLPKGAGLVIHSAGYGSGDFGSKGFTLLYRSASFLTFYPCHVTDGGEITMGLGSVLGQGNFTPATDDMQLRIRIWREGDTQRVQLWDAFIGGNLVIDTTISREDYPIHWAGVVGGLFWNNTSAGGTAALRSLTLDRS